MNFEIDGIDDMDARLEQRTLRLNQATGQALRDVTLDLQGKATMLAPIDTGNLRGSANSAFGEDGDTQWGEVRFQTPYARRQHEELHYEHPMGGQAKYLEQPLYENEGRYLQHIADAVRRSQE